MSSGCWSREIARFSAVQLVPFGGDFDGGLPLGQAGGDRVDGDAERAESRAPWPG